MRFLLLVASICLLVASGCLVGIFGPAPYAAVERLGHIGYFEYAPDGLSFFKLALTPARYAVFRVVLAGLLGGSLLATIAQLRAPRSRRQLRRLGQETHRAAAALVRTVRQLSVSERVVAGILLLSLLATWLVWFLIDPLSPDEIGSYDAFVHEGPVAIASFYPIPNNHVFYNFCCWLLSPLALGHVRVVMRLPSLLAATAGTALSYALLTRLCTFRVATVVTALFSLTPLTIIYAASGRGYYVQLLCLQLAFFAVVELMTARRNQRLAWAVFIGSSILGLYTVPTFASPLLALALVLTAGSQCFHPRQRGHFWGRVFGAGAIIGAIAAVLYAPVGCVSGWPSLLANRYLAPYAWAAFWRTLPAYAYEVADALLGLVRPGLIASAVLLGLTPLLLLRGTLPPRQRWLLWSCWALLLVPAIVMAAERRFIPARALMYATYFLYLLGALLADYAATRWRGRGATRLPIALLLILLLFRVAMLAGQVPALLRSRDETAAVARAYRWLLTQPPGPVFLGASYHDILFHHYALLDHRPLTLHAQRRVGTRYQFIVWAKGQPLARPAWASALPYRLAYQDTLATIYQLGPAPSRSR